MARGARQEAIVPGAAAATDRRQQEAPGRGGRCLGAGILLERAAALMKLARGRKGVLRAKPWAASIDAERVQIA